MKKFVFIGVMGLLSLSIHAQAWIVDGSISFNYYKWDNGIDGDNSGTFSLSLGFGKYLSERLALGLKAGFGIIDPGNELSAGAFVKYDIFKFDKVYFDATGGIYYTRFNRSYPWNDYFPENDANRILFQIAPGVNFMINKNVEVYWRFAAISYRLDWLTLKGTQVDCKVNEFRIAGPFSNPSFGLRFLF